MPDPLPQAPSFRLDGRQALVTGAGRGIGTALAAALADAGAIVTLVARSGSEVEEAAGRIRAAGGAASSASLDVTDLDAVCRFFEERSAFEVLVNNAGTNRPKLMQDVSDGDFDAVLGLNLKATYFVTQACVRQMLVAGSSGSLIHLSSQMGHVGGINRSLYCASKWAIEGMSKSFALDLASYGIRSNTIAPTFIDTPMTRPFLSDPRFAADVMSRIKLGRLGKPEDLTGAALFLASDASSMVTGTSLIVDGGWTAD